MYKYVTYAKTYNICTNIQNMHNVQNKQNKQNKQGHTRYAQISRNIKKDA